MNEIIQDIKKILFSKETRRVFIAFFLLTTIGAALITLGFSESSIIPAIFITAVSTPYIWSFFDSKKFISTKKSTSQIPGIASTYSDYLAGKSIAMMQMRTYKRHHSVQLASLQLHVSGFEKAISSDRIQYKDTLRHVHG